jgi:hypothetical protein
MLTGLGVAGTARAAGGVEQQASPTQANVGDEITLTYTVHQVGLGGFQFPQVDGLEVERQATSSNFSVINSAISISTTLNIVVVPQKPGDFVIPSFAMGNDLKTDPIYLHVANPGGGPNASAFPSTAAPGTRTGPVVIPPDATSAQQPTSQAASGDNGTISVPVDANGQPRIVFVIVTPQTTDAYVGQSIPLRIETYIRLDANAPQNSLPTLKGGDFLMNDLSLRPNEDEVDVMGQAYVRDSWTTAISASRSGDFPLQMERDTYWSPAGSTGFPGFFGSFFRTQGDLQHQNIASNAPVMHIHPLPDEGRPEGFGGAIGKFQAAGTATPDSVQVGEPVTLRFTITGTGNFDYVKIPYLRPDPAWKTYAPTSRTRYVDEAHLNATKEFEQALIPQKNGDVPLPQASFSYFDPDQKKYETILIPLPTIKVTGTIAAAPAPVPAANAGPTAPATPAAPSFAPNELAIGHPVRSIEPLYRRPGFWMAQGVLAAMLAAATVLCTWRERGARRGVDPEAERARVLSRDEAAMAQAAQAGEAAPFFAAARRVVLGRVAQRWHVAPETLSLEAIRQHDAEMANRVEPLLTQADEVHYSGGTDAPDNLAAWHDYVLELVRTL